MELQTALNTVMDENRRLRDQLAANEKRGKERTHGIDPKLASLIVEMLVKTGSIPVEAVSLVSELLKIDGCLSFLRGNS